MTARPGPPLPGGCGVQVGTAAADRPGQVGGDPPAGQSLTLVRALGSQGELVTRNKVVAGERSRTVGPQPRGRRPARLRKGT